MEEAVGGEDSTSEQAKQNTATPSKKKANRIMLLAMALQVSAPARLSWQDIQKMLPFYGDNPRKAIYRDIATLAGTVVEQLPKPDDPSQAEWCIEQQGRDLLAITYNRQAKTFGLAQSVLSIEINEDEARAFVALREGFTPGTPYAEAVQHLLRRWEWLFSEKSRQLVIQKRRRQARPVLLPLSPVVDYQKHQETILLLDAALEEGAYLSFAYTALAQNWDDEPQTYQRVEPYELEYRDGHWYFTAYLFEMNTFLDFRVDRIHPGTLVKDRDRFYPGNRQRPRVKIRYWVSPMLARHGSISARLQEQHVEFLDDDQGAIVEGYARSVWWARKLLLGYGELVKALYPPDLVQQMRQTAVAMRGLYEEEEQ
jgi:predicted DNA-binding transcriptional regulator YafY